MQILFEVPGTRRPVVVHDTGPVRSLPIVRMASLYGVHIVARPAMLQRGHVFEPELLLPWKLVHAASNPARLVAGSGQDGRERVLDFPLHALLISHHAVGRGGLTRQQGTARGNTGRTGRVCPGEANTCPRNRVHVGRQQYGMVFDPETIAAVLFREEQQEVWLLAHFTPIAPPTTESADSASFHSLAILTESS